MAEEGAPFGGQYRVREHFLLSNAQLLALMGLLLMCAYCSSAAFLIWTSATTGWVLGDTLGVPNMGKPRYMAIKLTPGI